MAAGSHSADHEFLCQRDSTGRFLRPALGGLSGGVVQLAREFSRARHGGAARGERCGSVAAEGQSTCAESEAFGHAALVPVSGAGIISHPKLVATFAVGFNVLFSLVGVFTWITFYLAAAPFHLSTTGLSSLFFVYLVGLVVTPAAGLLITRVGLRAGIGGAIGCSIAGVLLTLAHALPVVIVGLAMLSSGVFIAQTASQSHLRVAAPAGAKVKAAGLYITCYYLGGTAAGVVPGIFWALGKWPACVGFIVAMQLLALAVALVGWRAEETA